MAFNWDNVNLIRQAQESARERFKTEQILNNTDIQETVNAALANGINTPRLTEVEQMIFRMRSELITYLTDQGLVDGALLDGTLLPVQGMKIVISAEALDAVCRKLDYVKMSAISAYLDKLDTIEAGAEVNKVIDVCFNGVSVLDKSDRTAYIDISAQDILDWLDTLDDFNIFTNAYKAQLDELPDWQSEIEAGIEGNADDITAIENTIADHEGRIATLEDFVENVNPDAEENLVNDVTLDGKSIVEDKIAVLTGAAIKDAYEAQPDTNAFTDAAKVILEALPTEHAQIIQSLDDHSQRLGKLEVVTARQQDKLDTIDEGAEVNLVNDVLLNGESVVLDKVAILDDETLGIEEIRTGLSDLTSEVADLATETGKLDAKVSELSDNVSILSETVDNFEGRISTNTDDIADLKDAVDNIGSPVKDVFVDGESVVDEDGNANITIPEVDYPVKDVFVDGESVVDEDGNANITIPEVDYPVKDVQRFYTSLVGENGVADVSEFPEELFSGEINLTAEFRVKNEEDQQWVNAIVPLQMTVVKVGAAVTIAAKLHMDFLTAELESYMSQGYEIPDEVELYSWSGLPKNIPEPITGIEYNYMLFRELSFGGYEGRRAELNLYFEGGTIDYIYGNIEKYDPEVSAMTYIDLSMLTYLTDPRTQTILHICGYPSMTAETEDGYYYMQIDTDADRENLPELFNVTIPYLDESESAIEKIKDAYKEWWCFGDDALCLEIPSEYTYFDLQSLRVKDANNWSSDTQWDAPSVGSISFDYNSGIDLIDNAFGPSFWTEALKVGGNSETDIYLYPVFQRRTNLDFVRYEKEGASEWRDKLAGHPEDIMSGSVVYARQEKIAEQLSYYGSGIETDNITIDPDSTDGNVYLGWDINDDYIATEDTRMTDYIVLESLDGWAYYDSNRRLEIVLYTEEALN